MSSFRPDINRRLSVKSLWSMTTLTIDGGSYVALIYIDSFTGRLTYRILLFFQISRRNPRKSLTLFTFSPAYNDLIGKLSGFDFLILVRLQ